jgi:hypothetical protein
MHSIGKPVPELPAVFQDTERGIDKQGYEKQFEILAFAPMESEDGEFKFFFISFFFYSSFCVLEYSR